MTAVRFGTVTEARKHLSDLIDAAESGRPATVVREGHRAAVVDATRLRDALARMIPARTEVVPEADGWSIFLPGLPLAADGATYEEALREMTAVLRDYAEDWSARLLHAPNHLDNWALVQLIELSDDDELRDWLQA